MFGTALSVITVLTMVQMTLACCQDTAPTAAQRWMKVKYNGDEIDCSVTVIEKKYYKSC